MTEQPLETGSGIAVLADDLSGAAEVAGVFLGRDVPLFLQLNDFQPLPGVTVIDLNTRAMAPQKAAQTIRAALADIPADIRVVKKIDSLLRGHIGTEVAVLAERGLVIMSAALPGLGRTPSVHDVAQLFADRPLAAGRLEIHDAATDADLDEIVRAAPPGAQLVGTSALAAAVARTLPLAHQKIDVRPPAKAVLTVVGTAAPVAAGQVDALIVAHCCMTRPIPSRSSAHSTTARPSSPSAASWSPRRPKQSRSPWASSSPPPSASTAPTWS
jgi:uncharacterized protein YgbK (DUF1537 family)